MKLVIAEKNIAAQKIAQLLSDAGKPKNDKVYNTAVCSTRNKGGTR